MKRVLALVLAVLPMCLMAQRIGYFSKQAIIEKMPEYVQAQESLNRLKLQYDAECLRGDNEFQRKFSEFLQGQKEFPQNILIKRQAELQTLMEAGVKFHKEAQDLLAKAKREHDAVITKKLNAVLRTIGREGNYICILNTDNELCPYLDDQLADDITYDIQLALGIIEAPVENLLDKTSDMVAPTVEEVAVEAEPVTVVAE